MTSDTASILQHDRTVFDGWRPISLSLYMTLAGYAVLVGVPVISTAWVNLLGFSEIEVGRVAGADLGGLSLGALLTAALVAMAIIVGMLAGGINDRNIVISVFSFNFLWIFVDVYQMSTVANVDHSGRYAALMPGAQELGQIIGPNLAATILALGFGYSGVFIMCTIAALTAMLIYATMYFRRLQAIPALADAS